MAALQAQRGIGRLETEDGSISQGSRATRFATPGGATLDIPPRCDRACHWTAEVVRYHDRPCVLQEVCVFLASSRNLRNGGSLYILIGDHSHTYNCIFLYIVWHSACRDWKTTFKKEIDCIIKRHMQAFNKPKPKKIVNKLGSAK